MKLLLRKILLILITWYLFFSCQREYSCENCKGVNEPPIANAGNDQLITLPTDSIALNGASSSDPDGSIVDFRWTKISGPALFSILSASSSVTKVTSLQAGKYQFELKVTDNGGLFSMDTTEIIVDAVPTNHPPLADAGRDTAITVPLNSVVIDGSASHDPDNNILSYAWTKISGPSIVTILNPIGIQTQVEGLLQGVYQFELIVTDAGGLFSKDTVTITVKAITGLPPIAKAGNDTTVNYELQNCGLASPLIFLDGSRSADPDGFIVSYQWTLITGTNFSVAFVNPNSVTTGITNLLPGTYSFRLVVTDNNGATDDDTLFIQVKAINRPVIQAQLIPAGTLSQQRKVSAVATIANKIFFAGGTTPSTSPGPHFSSRVDILDINTGSWNTAELSQPRWGLAAVTASDKVFFAGGTATTPAVRQTSRIDVFDALSGSWSVVELPQPGHFSSIAVGAKVFFAGGNSVFIYNSGNNSWSTKNLSQPRYLISPANVQGKLYFAGGGSTISGGMASNAIDIYDPSTDAWSVSSLSKPKFGIASVGMRGKTLWAGGTTSNGITNEVEFFDFNTQSTTFACLFQANSFSQYRTARKDNNVVFWGNDGTEKNKFDIYDAINDTWSIGILDQAIIISGMISVNNAIYITGASATGNGYSDQVWKLEF